MRANTEFSIELDDQDLMDLPDPASVEIDDIEQAQIAPVLPVYAPNVAADSEVIEIEMTAEEMDALLSGT